MWRGGLVITAAIIAYWLQLSPTLPFDRIRDNAQKRFNGSHSEPLTGKTAIVTGATGGLGLHTALQLSAMGCHVILAVRSLSKCETLRETFFNTSSISSAIATATSSLAGSTECARLDTSDLDSVGVFVAGLGGRKVDVLVNNAGMSYHSRFDPSVNPLKNLSLSTASPQGLDMIFATNYLGHWLLTRMLLPSLSSNARVINVASTYHWQVNGSDLLPRLQASPVAAQSLQDFRQRKLAYANSKLAQVLHARELQRRLQRTQPEIRVVSVCPGWVATDILPKGPIGKAIHALSFSETAGTLSILHAVTSPSQEIGDYICNGVSSLLSDLLSQSTLSKLGEFGLRDMAGDLIALSTLLTQRMLYGKQLNCQSSPESLNDKMMQELFDWSANFVSKYQIPR